MKKLTLTPEETKEVAHRFVHQVDKFSRMFAGLSSDLVKYVDGIIYIEISNSQRRILSTYNTAVHFAKKYRDFNDELKDAAGFVVIFNNRDNIPGFVINRDTNSEAIKEMVDEYNKPENPRIKNVFAGMFDEETEKIKQDLARDN